MDLDFLDGSAPELKAWLTDHGGYLFEGTARGRPLRNDRFARGL